jgi:hypothetical protein
MVSKPRQTHPRQNWQAKGRRQAKISWRFFKNVGPKEFTPVIIRLQTAQFKAACIDAKQFAAANVSARDCKEIGAESLSLA